MDDIDKIEFMEIQNRMVELQEEIQTNPQSEELHLELANTYFKLNRIDNAFESYYKCLSINPNHETAYYNIGTIHVLNGNYTKAIESFQAAIRLNPKHSEALMNLGLTFHKIGEPYDSEICLKHALNLEPKNTNILFNFGRICQENQNLEDAISYYNRAIKLNSSLLSAYYNLGSIYKQIGDVENAISCYEYVCHMNPNCTRALSNKLLCLNYLPHQEPAAIFQSHCEWGRMYGRRRGVREGPEDLLKAEHRLRVGYLSPDFRSHSVAFFFESLLRHHNPSVVESFCYSDVQNPDSTTRRLQSLSDHWANVHGLSNHQLKERIQRDGIDVLVDLAGHTAQNRMPLFARNVAPIQVSYLGYPNTTGLDTMDFRITDAIADPPGLTEHLYTERLVRLPEGFLCFSPLADSPEIAAPPLQMNRRITFGSFNNRAKITGEVLDVWCSILHQVPDSCLMLKFQGLDSRLVREPLLEHVRQRGLNPRRILFRDACDRLEEHLACYHDVDIALDPFPYNGTTTTVEALWMGVPVITKIGTMHVSRVGTSILSSIGLQWLAAATHEAYVDRAVRLANDPGQLAFLRRTLRETLQHSPLMDGARFTRHLEQAYQWMWHQKYPSSDQRTGQGHESQELDLATWLLEGEKAFEVGDLCHAESCFLKVLARHSDHQDALNNMGVILYQNGQLDVARAYFQKVLRLNPGHDESRSNLQGLISRLDLSEKHGASASIKAG